MDMNTNMNEAEQLRLLKEIGGNSAGWYLNGFSFLDFMLAAFFFIGVMIACYVIIKNYKLIVRKISLFILSIIWTVQAIFEVLQDVPAKRQENKRAFFKNLK